MALKLPTWY